MEIEKEKLEKILQESKTHADVCRKLKLVPSGANYRKVKDLIDKHQLTFTPVLKQWNTGTKVRGIRYTKEELLNGNPQYKNISSLRKRLIKEGIKKNNCEICGISGEQCSLELHHINGDHTNNTLINLQILCPNCHSKTENFRGKNINADNRMLRHLPREHYILTEEQASERDQLRKEIKKQKQQMQYRWLHPNAKEYIPKEAQETIIDIVQTCQYCSKQFHSRRLQKFCSQECYRNDNGRKSNRPSFLQLIQDFKELKSFTAVGNKYKVSDRAVVKWCKLYGIPFLSVELKAFLEKFI